MWRAEAKSPHCGRAQPNEEALTDTEKSLPFPPASQPVLHRVLCARIKVGRRAASQVGTGTGRDAVWACVCTCAIAGEGRSKSFRKPWLSDQEGTREERQEQGSSEQVWGAENKKET